MIPIYHERELSYINTNVCGEKNLNNTNDYMIQYIKHLPKAQYFRRG